MSELHEELLNIAEQLNKHMLKGKAPDFIDPLYQLEDAATSVGKAWSGSWLGYHATVYYSDLRSPPAGAHFSQEWGIKERFGIHDTSGNWREFRAEDLEKAIHELANFPCLDTARKSSEEIAQAVIENKAEVLSLLTTASCGREDTFIARLIEDTEKITLLTKWDLIEANKPASPLMSRDSLAASQGLRVPPHISVLCEISAIRHPVTACEKLAQVARQAGSHLARMQRREERSQVVGTNVFIGHGRSALWKDLKDFIQDRLRLPWDEFNRVPVAGVTNIARLSEMLNAAAIAFLVMTGEDEQADGKQHARMNVVHEAGLFQGRLGFTRAIVLLEEGCEAFSNIEGLGQIRFPKGNIRAVFEEVRQVIEREGLI